MQVREERDRLERTRRDCAIITTMLDITGQERFIVNAATSWKRRFKLWSDLPSSFSKAGMVC